MADAGSAVVTGAAMGMGKAIAARLVADGVVVAGLDRDEAALDETAAELGDEFVPVAGDVGDWAAHELRRTSPRPRPAPPLGEQRRHRHRQPRPRGDAAAHRRRAAGAADGRHVRLRHRRSPDAARPPRIDRQHLVDPGRGRLAPVPRLRRRQGGNPRGHSQRRPRLRSVRHPRERRAPRQRQYVRCSGPTSRTIRWRPSDGSPARRRWHRCSGSAIRPRSPRWSPSCSPTRRPSSPAPR